jgi:Galactose oxidase, central domain
MRRQVSIPLILLVLELVAMPPNGVAQPQTSEAATLTAGSNIATTPVARAMLASARKSLINVLGEPTAPRRPSVVITARCCVAMAFNPDLGTSGEVMLYGGRDAGTVYNGTWVWDGSAWNVLPTGTDPGPRRSGRMAWDAARHQMVMFGGSNTAQDAGALSDTWLFSNGNWNLCQACGTPGAIVSPGLAYDSVDQYVLEYGGSGADSAPNGLTWKFDGAWHQLFPGKSPISLASPALSFHQGLNRILLFGGHCTSGTGCTNGFYGDTWGWNGVNVKWTKMSVGTPGRRSGHRMEYDPSLSPAALVLFGGYRDNNTLFGDTWILPTTGGWSQCQALCSTSPADRCCTGLTYDPHNTLQPVIVMFGGSTSTQNVEGAPPGSYFDDTWFFDQTGWQCKAGTCSTGPATALWPSQQKGNPVVTSRA